MTNRFSLIAQREVMRSHLILGKTVDVLKLDSRWKMDRDNAIHRLEDALQLSPSPEAGTMTVQLGRIDLNERAEIINALCDQLPKESHVLNDTTPNPAAPDLRHPEQIPHSKNARMVQVGTEILKRAQ